MSKKLIYMQAISLSKAAMLPVLWIGSLQFGIRSIGSIRKCGGLTATIH